jgi:putative endonuclease
MWGNGIAQFAGHCLIIFMPGYVYILASRKNGTLYTGVTSDLERRVWERREEMYPGFTKKYGVKRLVWYRDYHDIRDAIDDEKRIKKWCRKWKLELIEAMNPDWADLYDVLNG